MNIFKRLREEWMYWYYRNITRRRQLLRARLRRQPSTTGTFRARGTAMYMPTRRGDARGLWFVVAVSAVLALVDTALYLYTNVGNPLLINLILLAIMTYLYIQYGGV